MTRTITPLGDRVLLRPLIEEVTKSGLHLPTQRILPFALEGTVLAIGSKVKACRLCLAIGTTVLFSKFAGTALQETISRFVGTEIQEEHDSLLIIREEDILGFISQPSHAACPWEERDYILSISREPEHRAASERGLADLAAGRKTLWAEVKGRWTKGVVSNPPLSDCGGGK